jgi:hypothetical protein
VQFNGPWDDWVSSTSLTTTSLTPDGGAPVTVAPQDSSSPNGGGIDNGVGLFPHQPLAPKTWYTARAAGSVTAEHSDPSTGDFVDRVCPFDVTWRFRTAGEDSPNSGRGGRTGRRRVALRAGAVLRGRVLRVEVQVGRSAVGQRARIVLARREGRRWHPLGGTRRVTLSRPRTSLKYRIRRGRAIRVGVRVPSFRTANGPYVGRKVVVVARRR